MDGMYPYRKKKMPPGRIILLFCAVLCPVIPVEGSRQRCHMNCNYPKSAPTVFERNDKLLKSVLISCRILESSNQTDICTVDVSQFVDDSCNSGDDINHYLSITCTNIQVRPVITNEQNVSCPNYVGYLVNKNCGLYWQDMEVYAEWLHLNVLMLDGCKDRWDEEIATSSYWAIYVNSTREEDFDVNGANTEPVLIPHGLREVGTLALFNMEVEEFPRIFQRFIWPLMAEIDLTNTPILQTQFHQVNECLQKTFPRLQTYERINCDLTQPPSDFPWEEEHLMLPRNLSRTQIFNSHYSNAYDIRVERNYYRRILILDGNNITDLSNFTFTGNLQQISLKNNHLSMLNNNLFVNMRGLQSIYLSNNLLRTLPSGLLLNQTSLFSISLANNQISDIPNSFFQNLPALKNIDLSGNLITAIPSGKFVELPLLQSVNLASNQIQYISDDAISPSQAVLEHLDLSKNQITIIPTFVFLLRQLRSTDLSSNQITFDSIKESLQNISLEHLYWAQRESAARYEDLPNDPNSPTLLTFENNNISTIDIGALNNNSFNLVALFFHYFNVRLEDNDFVCDCKLFPFYNYMHRRYGTDKLKKTLKVNDYNINNLKCKKPDNLYGKLLYNVDPSDFICAVSVAFCPALCTCFRRSVDGAVIVNCQQVGLISVPAHLPHKAIELDLTSNLISDFDIAYPYLRQLEKLHLQNNLISSISREVLDGLDKSGLKELKLDSNRLRALPHSMNVFRDTNLSTLTLGNNPWDCNCDTSWMKDWLILRRDLIEDLDEIMCVTGKPAGQVYIEVKEDQFICITPASIIVRNALLGVGAVILLLIILVILIYVYRGEIKILLYVHCNWHPFDAAEEADLLDMTYDAFISYSGTDYKWVCFNLLPKLENHNTPYRVCVHDRDFMPGAYIEDNIMEAVRTSRRMILVLSRNYLKSDWCMLEFRAAHNKVLNDRTNYLILVLYDDIQVSELDEDMQLYINTNTYLAISNKWFYDKLFYSMPNKNLHELRQEMEIKNGIVPKSPSLPFTYSSEQASASIQDSLGTEMTDLSC